MIIPPSYAKISTPIVSLPPTQPFQPTMLKGLKIDPKEPFRFNFVLDLGDALPKPPEAERDYLKTESSKLIKYFLASLTIPENDLWVNLNPKEPNRIIPDEFGTTEMGRDLLAQDYLLKQITSSLMNPEGEFGKNFWDRIYKLTYQKYGTTNIPVDTFNKVWIVPDKAVVYTHEKTAFVVEATLKIMLEEDYLNVQKLRDSNQKPKDPLTTEIIREVIIPELTKEVNAGESFAPLRQIYHSMILATWFKRNLKESILSQVYVNQNKTAGINIPDKNEKLKIYAKYLAVFKKRRLQLH